jgi:hypothetical protein
MSWPHVSNMRNAVSWDVAQCSFCNKWRFEGTCLLHLQGRNNTWARNSVISWLADLEDGSDIFPKRPFSQGLHFGHIPEDGILRSHRHENLKSYKNVLIRQIAAGYQVSGPNHIKYVIFGVTSSMNFTFESHTLVIPI